MRLQSLVVMVRYGMNDAESKTETASVMPVISRAEHLAWCKKRALEYCDIGDVNQAYASMASDLGKHPETSNHAAIQLGMMMLAAGHLGSPMKMREFIKGFN